MSRIIPLITGLSLVLLFWAPIPAVAQHSAQSGAVARQPTVSPKPGKVVFQADRVLEDAISDVLTLEGNVVVGYSDVEIRAARVVFNRRGRTLTAEAQVDSAGRQIGRPDFSRRGGRERFSGSRMVYHLDSGRGRVWNGRAVSQSKYFIKGAHAILDSTRHVHLKDISLTTCEEDHEHYRFLVNRLKLVENDKGVARNVTFELGPVPVAWFPFYVFPLRQGRHSGVLTPSIGSNSRDGITVNNLGYYYAPSEYWDATLRANVRETGGILLHGLFSYNVRRRMTGRVGLQFENFNTGTETSSRSWRFDLNHRQRLSSSANIRATGNFTDSRSFDERNANDLYTFLNRQLRSSLSLDKNWREAGRNVDLSMTYIRDLDSKENSFQGFPKLTFRQGRRRIFGSDSDRASSARTGGPWYRAFYYSLSGDLNNRFSRTPDETDEPEDLAIGGRLTVNSQHRPFGWIELTPSFSTTQRVSRNNTNSATRRETYSGSVTTGTTLYGIFNVRAGRLRGIRHRFQPRVGFRYTQNATVSGGTFGFGGTRTAGDARRSATVSLANSFDVKTADRDEVERRFTFLTANVNTALDFDAPGRRRVQPVRTTLSVKPDRRIDLRVNMTHELYDENDAWKPFSPLLRNLSATTSLRFAGSREDKLSRDDRTDFALDRFGERSNLNPSDFGYERNLDRDIDRTRPWHLSIGHQFKFRRTGATTTRTSWIRSALAFSPHRDWRVDYSIRMDLVNPDVTNQEISIYKDLHCFEAQARVIPNGFARGAAFKINIKEFPQFGFSTKRGNVYGI